MSNLGTNVAKFLIYKLLKKKVAIPTRDRNSAGLLTLFLRTVGIEVSTYFILPPPTKISVLFKRASIIMVLYSRDASVNLNGMIRPNGLRYMHHLWPANKRLARLNGIEQMKRYRVCPCIERTLSHSKQYQTTLRSWLNITSQF